MSKLLKAMCFRRAFPKTPAKFSVSPGLPLNKIRSLLIHSESTLPQPLIPLSFISFSSNVYRKSGEGLSLGAPKFCNSSLHACRSYAHARTPATPFRSYACSITRGHPGGGVSLWWDSQSWLSFFGLSQVTEHGPRPHWSPGTVAAQPTKCQNHGWYSLVAAGETNPLQAVSKVLRADIGRGKELTPSRSQVDPI